MDVPAYTNFIRWNADTKIPRLTYIEPTTWSATVLNVYQAGLIDVDGESVECKLIAHDQFSAVLTDPGRALFTMSSVAEIPKTGPCADHVDLLPPWVKDYVDESERITMRAELVP